MSDSHTNLVGPIACEILRHYIQLYSALRSVTVQEPCTSRLLSGRINRTERYPEDDHKFVDGMLGSLLVQKWF